MRDSAGNPIEVWSVRNGSVGKEGDRVFAVVEVAKPSDAPQSSPIYKVSVNFEHCGKPRGDISVATLNGAIVEAGVYVKGRTNVASHLAEHLCRRAAQ